MSIKQKLTTIRPINFISSDQTFNSNNKCTYLGILHGNVQCSADIHAIIRLIIDLRAKTICSERSYSLSPITAIVRGLEDSDLNKARRGTHPGKGVGHLWVVVVCRRGSRIEFAPTTDRSATDRVLEHMIYCSVSITPCLSVTFPLVSPRSLPE